MKIVKITERLLRLHCDYNRLQGLQTITKDYKDYKSLQTKGWHENCKDDRKITMITRDYGRLRNICTS